MSSDAGTCILLSHQGAHTHARDDVVRGRAVFPSSSRLAARQPAYSNLSMAHTFVLARLGCMALWLPNDDSDTVTVVGNVVNTQGSPRPYALAKTDSVWTNLRVRLRHLDASGVCGNVVTPVLGSATVVTTPMHNLTSIVKRLVCDVKPGTLTTVRLVISARQRSLATHLIL